MTPMQKLSRLAAIHAQLYAITPARLGSSTEEDDLRQKLQEERHGLLTSVGLPPLDLPQQTSPEDWAQLFVAALGNQPVTFEQAAPWFTAAMQGALYMGRLQQANQPDNRVRVLLECLRGLQSAAGNTRVRVDGALTSLHHVAEDALLKAGQL